MMRQRYSVFVRGPSGHPALVKTLESQLRSSAGSCDGSREMAYLMLPDESIATFCIRHMPQYKLVATLFSGPSASAPPNVVALARHGTGGGELALPQRSIFIGQEKKEREPADTDRSDIRAQVSRRYGTGGSIHCNSEGISSAKSRHSAVARPIDNWDEEPSIESRQAHATHNITAALGCVPFMAVQLNNDPAVILRRVHEKYQGSNNTTVMATVSESATNRYTRGKSMDM
jgi:hypothetical protein